MQYMIPRQAQRNTPEYIDIPDLLEELVEYVNTTDDHPLIIAAIVHYQLVTIHPFEDGKVTLRYQQNVA